MAVSRVTIVQITLAIFASVPLIDCGRSAASYLNRGDQLFEQGKFAEAELNYRKALQKDHKSGEAHHRLGLTDLKEGKPAEAFQYLLQATQLMPENQAAKLDLANLVLPFYLQDVNRPKLLYDLLVKLSDELLRRDAESSDGLRIKGHLALVEHRPEEAEALFRRAHQAQPGRAEVVIGWIEALNQAHRFADAEKAALDFLASDKSAGAVYDALFHVYATNGRQADAESVLIRKVRDNPKEGPYILQLAAYYARAKKPADMRAALQPLLADRSTFPHAHRDVGDFFFATGDWPRALDQYQAGETDDPKEFARYRNRTARVLAVQNKRDEAIQLLDGLIKANPDYKEARTLRAALLIDKPASSKPDEGLGEFQSLLDKSPEDVSLRYLYSKALFEKGNLPESRAQLIEVTRRSPAFPQARVDLADVALQQGQLKDALQEAGAALELDPNNPRAQYIRGSALLALGNLDQAEAAFTSLSRQLPKSIDVRLQLALLESRRKRFAQAEAAYKRILDAAPMDWRVLAGLVDNYSAENRLDKAFPLLESELKKSSGAAPIRDLLARAAVKDRRYDVAIEQYRQLAAGHPNDIDPLLQLSEVLKLKGDVAGAMADLSQAASIRPRDVRPRAMLAELLHRANRDGEAKSQWRQALSIQPNDPRLMNNLAYLLADSSDSLDEAVKLARQATNQAPADPNFTDTLGWVYLKKGRIDDALLQFRRLNTQHSDNYMFSYHFGVALAQHGERAAARLQLAHALGLQPPQDIRDRIQEALEHLNQ